MRVIKFYRIRTQIRFWFSRGEKRRDAAVDAILLEKEEGGRQIFIRLLQKSRYTESESTGG